MTSIQAGALGPYRLDAHVGSNAISTLHRAQDRFRDRTVALRVFTDSTEHDWRTRTWEAVRATAAATVAPVHEYGRLGGHLFVASEWQAGTDLGSRLRKGPLTSDEALRLGADLAEVLHAVHRLGGVHGCIRPAVVLCHEGAWRLVDFAASPGPMTTPESDVDALGQLLRDCFGGLAGTTPALRALLGGAVFTAPELRAAADRDLAASAAQPSVAASGPRTTTSWWGGAAPAPTAVPEWLVPDPEPLVPTVPVTGPDQSWWRDHASGQHPIPARILTIGRDPDSDLVVDDLTVSWRHAELRRVGDTLRIVDRSGWGGTFVNGRQISDTTLGADDVISIGHVLFRVENGTLVGYTDAGDITFRADDLVVTASGKRLLDGVGFTLEERSLLAVVGPSGAGKSTLLRALTGSRPADSGTVEYSGRDLYDNYDELRRRIGVVPQDDILHPQLTVRTALRYAARLRFPAGTGSYERERRIEQVLARLGLDGDVGRQRISTLSGGQRKRTSVALELLTRPSLLFLDEPTTGLDPGHRRGVMQTLRELADEGHTVVTVTHDESSLAVCDRLLVLCKGGRVAYFGPPEHALSYFGATDFPEMFSMLDGDDVDWATKFRNSAEAVRFHRTAGGRGGGRPLVTVPTGSSARQQPALGQFVTLCRRYLAVIAADRPYALFLLILPFVVGAVSRVMPGGAGLSMTSKALESSAPGAPQQLLLVLMVGAAFCGFAGSFRELVKEREIYLREQAIGVSWIAYIASKVAVLGAITVLQAVLIVVIGTAAKPDADSPVVFGSGTVEIILAIVALSVSLMFLGLLVSALIENADRGMPVLVLVFLMQFVLCGTLFPLSGIGGLEQLSWLVPARWAYGMGAVTASFPPPGSPSMGSTPTGPTPIQDAFWTHSVSTWWLDLVALAGLTGLFLVATSYALVRLKPRRRRW